METCLNRSAEGTGRNLNRSYCNTCQKLVSTKREQRENKVFLVKDCPDCGVTETLISADAARHNSKRDLDQFTDYHGCKANCPSCTIHGEPKYAFIDVTSRCNQKCPMCADSVPKLGFSFDPPMEYIDKLFQHLATLSQTPTVALFGGEPTLREDILDIIKLSRSYGFPTRILTNGQRLADPDFCRKLVESKVHILMSYDGANPEMYERLRGSAKALDRKLKAIENLEKINRGKVSYVTCLQWGMNEHELPGILEMCHRQRRFLRDIYLMPLTPIWDPSDFEYRPPRITTEDVEALVEKNFPGEKVEFLPLGFVSGFITIAKYIGGDPLPYRGGHPNCESLYMLISDGEQWRPVSHYLKRSTIELGAALAKLEACLASREERLAKRPLLGSLRLRKAALALTARLKISWTFMSRMRLSRLFKGKGVGKIGHALAIPFEVLIGRRFREVFRRHATIQGRLLLITLPLEDNPILETDRLERCPSLHVFMDPETGAIRYASVCAWRHHNKQVLGALAKKYQTPSAQ